MKLTYQNIMALQSLNRGWNHKVLELIGVSWPPQRGWIKKITGTEIEESTYNQAFELKDSMLKPKTIDRLRRRDSSVC